MITPEQQFIIDVTVEMILNLPDAGVLSFTTTDIAVLSKTYPNEFNAAVTVAKDRQQQQNNCDERVTQPRKFPEK